VGLPKRLTAVWSVWLDAELAKSWIPKKIRCLGGLGPPCVPSLHLTLPLQRGYSARHEVKQFHFTSWPEHGVPYHATGLLAFIRRVKASTPPDAGPIVIHCRYVRGRGAEPAAGGASPSGTRSGAMGGPGRGQHAVC